MLLDRYKRQIRREILRLQKSWHKLAFGFV